MPALETLLPFFGLCLLLALTPGPDNVFVLLQSARYGARAGLCVVLGLCVGLVGHTAAVALGLAALVAASGVAFAVLKYCGAAWLLWLAWHAWRAQAQPVAAAPPNEPFNEPFNEPCNAPLAAAPLPGALRMIGRGVVMNLTNPKVLLFFLALLPQFADPAYGSIPWQIMQLGLIFMCATWLVFGAIACFSGAFGAVLLRSARARQWLDRVAALVFVGLALKLATVGR